VAPVGATEEPALLPHAAEMADRVLTLRDGRLAAYEHERPARIEAVSRAQRG